MCYHLKNYSQAIQMHMGITWNNTYRRYISYGLLCELKILCRYCVVDPRQHKLGTEQLPESHYGDVIMTTIASQITSLTIVYPTLYSGADQSKDQSSASLAFVWGIHRGPVNSPHKGPVTRKMFPFDDVIMSVYLLSIGPLGANCNKIR